MEVINLVSGDITSIVMPAITNDGCAVEHEGYIYWVRGSTDLTLETNQAFRGLGESSNRFGG